jgi:integrase
MVGEKHEQDQQDPALTSLVIDIGDALDVGAARTLVGEATPDPVTAYLDGLKSPRSRTTMADALQRASRVAGLPDGFSAWYALRPDQFLSLRRRLTELHRPATVSLSLVALRGVLRTSWRLGLLSYEQLAKDTDWPKNLRASRLPAGRHIPEDERVKISAYTASLPGAHGALVRGCFAMMLGGALRAFEVCSLVKEAYNPTARNVRLIGKGDKEAEQPLQGDDAANAVEEWRETRSTLPTTLPWLFLRARSVRAPRGEMLSVKWLEHMCLSVAKGADVPRFSPHDCRRTVATSLLESGVDLAVVQRFLRHGSPDTTALYDRRQALADAAAVRAVPSIYRQAAPCR